MGCSFLLNIATFVVFCLSRWLLSSSGHEIVSSTGALLSFPLLSSEENTADLLFNMTFEVSPAHFGYNQYGGYIEALLVIPMSTSYHLECNDGEPKYLTINNSNNNYDPTTTGSGTGTGTGTGDGYGQSTTVLANPYIRRIKDLDVSSSVDFIFVIDRGGCYFVDKVENAQALGASAVIICDIYPQGLFTMMAPAEWEDNISIPSVFLQRTNCEKIMAQLGVKDWNPIVIDDTTYPIVENYTWTTARLEWGLPHPDDRVEWQLWTSSDDEGAIDFKRNFRTTSNSMDAQNYTVFEPHLYLVDGSRTCGGPTLPCGNQCSNSGRYCSKNAGFNTEIGVDGLNVMQENLRSLCVWEFDKNYSKPNNNNTLWWDYTVRWDEFCFIPDISNNSGTFNENCSFTQMKIIHPEPYNNGEPTLHSFVQKCINESGGYGYRGGVNSLLAKEAKLRTDSAVYRMPFVHVNEFWIKGNIDCDIVTIQSCTVFSAICAGFIEGTQPDVCSRTPAPTVYTCPEAEQDCNGTCFGHFEWDRCERCLLVSDVQFDACVGCDGFANSGYEINPCGECYDSSSESFQTYGQDCSGLCFGPSVIDRCGLCLPPYSDSYDACVGCDNVVGSDKIINPCGFCISRTSLDFNHTGRDCSGTCNGVRHIDDCGICLLEIDNKFNNCTETLVGNNTNNNDRETSLDRVLTTVIVVVCVVAFLIVIFSCWIIGRLWKRQRSITTRFNALASTYQMMDELPAAAEEESDTHALNPKNNSGLQQMTTTTTTPSGYAETVGDDDDDDD